MTVLVSTFCDGIASTHLDTYSTANNIYSFEKEVGNGPIKSIPQHLKT